MDAALPLSPQSRRTNPPGLDEEMVQRRWAPDEDEPVPVNFQREQTKKQTTSTPEQKMSIPYSKLKYSRKETQI